MRRSGDPARARTAAFACAVLAAVLISGCTLQSSASERPTPVPADAVAVAVGAGPALSDNSGAPLRAEHAMVVRAVYDALLACDMGALQQLYVGDEWPAQAALLGLTEVRNGVRAALEAPPANLGEGYVYSAGAYQAGFFLAPEDGGPLQWRGIEAPAGMSVLS